MSRDVVYVVLAPVGDLRYHAENPPKLRNGRVTHPEPPYTACVVETSLRNSSTSGSGETGTASPPNEKSQRANESIRLNRNLRRSAEPSTATPRRAAAFVGPLVPMKSTSASFVSPSPSSHGCRA